MIFTPPNIIRVIKSRIRWDGYVECMGDKRGAYRVLVGRPEGKRYLEDLSVEAGWGCMDWINLAQDRDRWLVACEIDNASNNDNNIIRGKEKNPGNHSNSFSTLLEVLRAPYEF
jgi:hypothetical protein